MPINLNGKELLLTAYLKEIISSIQPTYQYLGITLKTDISPSLPALFIDPVKLKQALLNLLRNAAEAISSADGKVKLCAFSSDQRVHIVITDNGCGIPESQLNEIFTPFVTFKEGGTGLGLAITREIIQLTMETFMQKLNPMGKHPSTLFYQKNSPDDKELPPG